MGYGAWDEVYIESGYPKTSQQLNLEQEILKFRQCHVILQCLNFMSKRTTLFEEY